MNKIFESAARRSPEAELILRCLQLQQSTENDARARHLLESSVDWPTLGRLAKRHAVLPMLVQQLQFRHWSLVPQTQQSWLVKQARDNAIRNLGTAAELVELVELCRQQAVTVIPFKGVVLGQQLHGDIGTRVANDLDLLVSRKDIAQLQTLLTRRGYQAGSELRTGYHEQLLRLTDQLPFVQRDRPWIVELHTALLDGSRSTFTTFEAMAPRLETLEFCARNLRVLRLEELLIYLCSHGTKHCWDRLGWVLDIAQLVQRYPKFDWQLVRDRAQEMRSQRGLLVGLMLAERLFGTPAPPIESDSRVMVESLADFVARRLFRPSVPQGDTFRRLSFQLRCQDVWRDRFELTWNILMRPTIADWQALPLPARLASLYYLIRPVRLLSKYGAWLLTRPRAIPFQARRVLTKQNALSPD